MASKLSSDEFGGLSSQLTLSKDARVMLTRNLWIQHGLCNGSMGYVRYIIYAEGASPPSLPLAVVVHFDNYTGPSFDSEIEQMVPITPVLSETYYNSQTVERQQLPLKLCLAITIHKSQGLTLNKATINIGSTEKVAGLAYVALSRDKRLEDLLMEPVSYERLTSVRNSVNFQYRVGEETRLDRLAATTESVFEHGVTREMLIQKLE